MLRANSHGKKTHFIFKHRNIENNIKCWFVEMSHKSFCFKTYSQLTWNKPAL